VPSVLNARLASVVAGCIGLAAAFAGTAADYEPARVPGLLMTLMVAFTLLMLCRGLFGRRGRRLVAPLRDRAGGRGGLPGHPSP